MKEHILCRSEPYLKDKILFSLEGDILSLDKEELKGYDMEDFFLVRKDKSLKNGLSAPLVVQIQTTNRCNFSCKHCYSSSGVSFSGEMNNSDIIKLLDGLKKWGVLKIQWVGGEVFTKKGFWELVKYADILGFDQSLLTNGTFFGVTNKLENIKKAWNYFYIIQVSMDDYGEGFDQFVGRKAWSSVCRSIERLSSFKPKGRILSIATIIRNDNLSSLSSIAGFVDGKVDTLRFGKEIVTGRSQEAQESSIKALFDSWPITNILRSEYPSLLINHPFDKMKGDEEESTLPFDWKSDNGARTFMYINAKGLAYPFPLLMNIKGFCGGSVFKKNFDDIWNSDAFVRYRNITRDQTGCGGCCEPCQIWPRYHFIVGDSLDLNTEPFSHPGCLNFKTSY